MDLTLYLKKDGTGRIVKQVVKNLNIDEAAAITVLYDGVSTIKPYYYDKVKISAEGYKVLDSYSANPSAYKDYFELKYDTDLTPDEQTSHNVEDFVLYFLDKTDNLTKVSMTISGLHLYKNITYVDLLYNGEELQDWYNDNVTLTATKNGNIMYISEDSSSGFSDKYVIRGNGIVNKKLYFAPNEDGSGGDGNAYDIVVSIDKTAPSATITINGTSSSSFQANESPIAYVSSSSGVSISASDSESGVDSIKYIISEKRYSSKEDLIAGVKEDKKEWRTYTAGNAISLTKDKDNFIYAMVTDKAGNITYVALGSVMYDTVAPKMTTYKTTDVQDSSNKVLVLAGTDDLSGINRFKLVVREKNGDKMPGAPDKDYMFNMGEYIEASKSSGKEAGATYTVKGLESNKTYVLFVCAVDRAGNISDVKSVVVEGTDDSSSSKSNNSGSGANGGGGSGSGSSGGNSSLRPAPNGIAGGNSGQPKTKPASGTSSSTASQTQQSTDRVISRDPYIAEATGSTQIGPINTNGWNKIIGEVKKADDGTQMSIEMSGMSVIPQNVIEEVKNRNDEEVTFLVNDDVEWTIHGPSINEEGIKDVDLGVKIGSKNIPAKILDAVAGSYQHIEFSTNQEGDLGFTATISIPVGKSNAGLNANLYYYDPKKNELQGQKVSVVDDLGRAKFDLNHCSDYTIIITPDRLLSPAELSYGVTTTDTLTKEDIFDGTKIRLVDLFGISGKGRIWLFVIAAVSAALCAAILYMPGFQRNER